MHPNLSRHASAQVADPSWIDAANVMRGSAPAYVSPSTVRQQPAPRYTNSTPAPTSELAPSSATGSAVSAPTVVTGSVATRVVLAGAASGSAASRLLLVLSLVLVYIATLFTPPIYSVNRSPTSSSAGVAGKTHCSSGTCAIVLSGRLRISASVAVESR